MTNDVRGHGRHLSGSQPLLLTVREAAALLGLGRTTAYELIAVGELEVVHIGRAARVPLASLEDYVERLRLRERAS